MTMDERPIGAARRSNGSAPGRSRNRPPWLLIQDGGVPSTAAATAHRTPARFPLEDILASPSTGRRGTGAFLPCVQVQNPQPQPQSPQPTPRPSGKATRPNNNHNTSGTATATATLKKPRHSPSASKRGGGPGMHVLFVDSSSRPCGTGVFLPRSTGDQQQPQARYQSQQKQQQRASHDKKPPSLLPDRVMHLLNLHRVKHHAAAWTAVDTTTSTTVPKDKIPEEQRRGTHGEGEKRGNAVADADYYDGAGNRHHAASNANKCSVPLQAHHTSAMLIEKLLPEEWSY